MIWTFGQQFWNGLVTGIAYNLFAMGLTLIFGIMGVINIAHGELYMIGTLLFWTLVTIAKVPFFLGMIISILVVALFGIIFNWVAIRPLLEAHPLSILLSTIAMSFILKNGSMIIWGVDARSIETPFTGTFRTAGIAFTHTSLILCLIGVIALVSLFIFLKKSILGKTLRATSQDRIGAALFGININRVYSITMIIAAGLAALAGTIIGPIWIAHPEMGQTVLLKGFSIVIIGGMGNLRGCVIVGTLLGITEAMFSQYISTYYKDVYAFGIMILVLLIRPQGLFSRA